jgi:hypothetical protein
MTLDPLRRGLVSMSQKFAEELTENRKLRAELESLRQAQYVPGVWQCRTCNFVQVKSILAVNLGEILADRETHMDPCPNEGDVMFPVTWKEYYEQAAKAFESQVARAVAAELALRKVKLAALSGTNAQAQFGRIIRICIDAGVAEKLTELEQLLADGKGGA